MKEEHGVKYIIITDKAKSELQRFHNWIILFLSSQFWFLYCCYPLLLESILLFISVIRSSIGIGFWRNGSQFKCNALHSSLSTTKIRLLELWLANARVHSDHLSTTKIRLLELWLANARVHSDHIVYYDYKAEILRPPGKVIHV